MTNAGSDGYIVRTMRPEEVVETYEMIDKEGWNLTLDKFTRLFESSPGEFYVAVAQDGEVAGKGKALYFLEVIYTRKRWMV